jgi:hypothetical protein
MKVPSRASHLPRVDIGRAGRDVARVVSDVSVLCPRGGAPSETTSLVGAYFFGALRALAPQLQAREIHLGPTELWTNFLPIPDDHRRPGARLVERRAPALGAPASLGLPYVREQR